jgi:predicted RNA-binding protein YlqC (UPF0109 family)
MALGVGYSIIQGLCSSFIFRADLNVYIALFEEFYRAVAVRVAVDVEDQGRVSGNVGNCIRSVEQDTESTAEFYLCI